MRLDIKYRMLLMPTCSYFTHFVFILFKILCLSVRLDKMVNNASLEFDRNIMFPFNVNSEHGNVSCAEVLCRLLM